MNKILITGGARDWAQDFKSKYKSQFNITTTNRVELDVTDPMSVDNYFKERSFDVVKNNAGCIHPKRILEADPHLWINSWY